MSSTSKSNKRRRSGAALIELALTLSILFSITWGTIEYGYYFFVKNTMEGAAREGCRAGIVAGATDSSITTAVINQLAAAGLISSGSSTTGNYTVTYADNGTSVSDISTVPIGDELTVTITATWSQVGSAVSPFGLIGTSKQLLTASSMRKEG